MPVPRRTASRLNLGASAGSDALVTRRGVAVAGASQSTSDFKGDRLSVAMFGIKPDGHRVTDASITGTAVTSASAGFAAGDVGKAFIFHGAGASGADLITTIAAFVSATQVTLAVAASTSISSGGVAYWGTNFDTQINVAVAAATTLNQALYFPAGLYLLNNISVTGMAAVNLMWFGDGDDTRLKFLGVGACINIDGSVAGGNTLNGACRGVIRDLFIDGNQASSYGLCADMLVRGEISNVRVTNVALTAFDLRSPTISLFSNLICSANDEALTIRPVTGINVTGSAPDASGICTVVVNSDGTSTLTLVTGSWDWFASGGPIWVNGVQFGVVGIPGGPPYAAKVWGVAASALVVSGNAGASGTPVPWTRPAGEFSAAGGNTFLNPVIEWVTGPGICFHRAETTNVLGGTSEDNGVGVQVDAISFSNYFGGGLDLEANSTSDLICDGSSNVFDVLCGSIYPLVFSGRTNVFGGYICGPIHTTAPAQFNVFRHVRTAAGGNVGTTVLAAIAVGVQTVTPASMAGIVVGTLLHVSHADGSYCDITWVTAVTSTTFTASFTIAKPGGLDVNGNPYIVARPLAVDLGTLSRFEDWYDAAANFPVGDCTKHNETHLGRMSLGAEVDDGSSVLQVYEDRPAVYRPSTKEVFGELYHAEIGDDSTLGPLQAILDGQESSSGPIRFVRLDSRDKASPNAGRALWLNPSGGRVLMGAVPSGQDDQVTGLQANGNMRLILLGATVDADQQVWAATVGPPQGTGGADGSLAASFVLHPATVRANRHGVLGVSDNVGNCDFYINCTPSGGGTIGGVVWINQLKGATLTGATLDSSTITNTCMGESLHYLSSEVVPSAIAAPEDTYYFVRVAGGGSDYPESHYGSILGFQFSDSHTNYGYCFQLYHAQTNHIYLRTGTVDGTGWTSWLDLTNNAGGPAGGDLSGTFPDPTVAAIQGVPFASTAPTTSQFLAYNGTQWAPTTTLPAAAFPALTGDVTTSAGSLATTLAATGVAANTYTKLTVDTKGRVTAGAQATSSDLSDDANLAKLNATNTFTATQTVSAAEVVITSADVAGGTADLRFDNTHSGAVHKYFRLHSNNHLEIANSAYSAVIFDLADDGTLSNVLINASQLTGTLPGAVCPQGLAISSPTWPIVQVTGTNPLFWIYKTNASADQKTWELNGGEDGHFHLRACSDDYSASTHILYSTRTGYTINFTAINHDGGNVLVGTTTDNGTDKLQVNGSISATNLKLSAPGSGAGSIATIDSTQTFTNKSIDAGQLTGTLASARMPALTGDVTTTVGTVATTVATVGGSTAANIHTAEQAANAATSADTASTLVKRDGSGNFSAGTINAALSGNASTATSASGLQGVAVSSSAPGSGQVLEYNGSQWAPASLGSAASVSGLTTSRTANTNFTPTYYTIQYKDWSNTNQSATVVSGFSYGTNTFGFTNGVLTT